MSEFKIGDKITCPDWRNLNGTYQHLTIEWLGGEFVAGLRSNGERLAWSIKAPWRLWVEPLVRRQWIIETERRRAEVGARYCVWHAEDATTIGPILKGDLIDGAVRDVIVSVRPVDGFAGEETK